MNPLLPKQQPFTVEPLEVRIAPAIFTVFNTDDSGVGSLRQAILDANANPGADGIGFDFPSEGIMKISPTAPLPSITGQIQILDSTDPVTHQPRVELDGSLVPLPPGNPQSGLVLFGSGSNGSTFKGLWIHDFDGGQIQIAGSANNRISGCFLGFAPGNPGAAGEKAGVWITSGSSNQIGGTASVDGNVIGGTQAGILLDAVTGTGGMDNLLGGTRIYGNSIGANRAGGAVLPNEIGIRIVHATETFVGMIESANVGGRNIISANTQAGISIEGDTNRDTKAFTVIRGNYIGTNAAGTSALGAQDVGIRINGASGIAIGDDKVSNTISGNIDSGVELLNLGTKFRSGNYAVTITNNYIGTDSTGTKAVPNHGDGILVQTANTSLAGTVWIQNNVVSGNVNAGINVRSIGEQPRAFVEITGNYVGTDKTGTTAIPNEVGVLLDHTQGVTIGGAFQSRWNVISGNTSDGIRAINGTAVLYIAGNLIGTNATGTGALGNGGNGIHFIGQVTTSSIGSGAPTINSPGNLISGNAGDGIFLEGRNATMEVHISGNFVGTTLDGSSALGNGRHGVHLVDSGKATFIGMGAPPDSVVKPGGSKGNVISANHGHGIFLENCADAIVKGNYIGIALASGGPLGNGGDGILLVDSDAVTVGDAQLPNWIAANSANGISLFAAHRMIQGATISYNIIGAAPGEGTATGNDGAGIAIDGAEFLVVEPRIFSNDIVANGGDGIRIGTRTSGATVFGNDIGVTDYLRDTPLISGNAGNGILILGRDIQIEGKLGSNTIVANGGSGIQVGLPTAPGTNRIEADNAYIRGNRIGILEGSEVAVPNGGDGIAFDNVRGANLFENEISGHNVQVRIGGRGEDSPLNMRIVSNSMGVTDDGLVIGRGEIEGWAGDFGILVEHATGVEIDSNEVNSMISCDIELRDASEVAVTGNRLGTGSGLGGNVGIHLVTSIENTIERNTVVQHSEAGIRIGQGSAGNKINGNDLVFIDGTGATLGEKGDGIVIDGATGTEVGIDQFGIGNDVLSEGGAALRLIGADGTTVRGNTLRSLNTEGVRFEEDTTGTLFVSNSVTGQNVGIQVAEAHSNTFSENVIEADGKGVVVLSGAANTFSRNSFALPPDAMRIDLLGDGITANDRFDVDNGPNHLQNSPQLLSAAYVPGWTLVRGIFVGAPNRDVHVELFEGSTWMAEVTVHTDGNGVASLAFDFDQEVINDLTATATVHGDTSEYSNSISPGIPPSVVGFGAAPGAPPRVRLVDAFSGETLLAMRPYGFGFRGGISVDTADVDGDGFTDLITAPGVGKAAKVKVFSGVDGHLITAFSAGRGIAGRTIAAGDIDGDGTIEILTAPASGAGGRVLIQDAPSGDIEREIFPFTRDFVGRIDLKLRDVDQDGLPEMIARGSSSGLGGGKQRVVIDLSKGGAGHV